MQRVGEGQRRQRVSTQIGERGVGCHVGRGGAEQRTDGPADGFQNRALRAVLAKRAQHLGLAVGQVDVKPLQLGAVKLVELGTGQLADAGEQTVLECERRRFDQEVARNFIGLQPGVPRDALQRFGSAAA